VPPFPPELHWIGERPPAVERLTARGPVLVHFICALDLNSVRTLPYLTAWHERYAREGLTVLGVNSPRFPPTGDRDKLATALRRLGVEFPVALDSRYRVWHAYGCQGWPSLFLWARGGVLGWYHFGEGEYLATEEEVRSLLHAERPNEPQPLAPLRPSDSPGARVVPPSPELFPGGSPSEPWSVSEEDERLSVEYEAGGAAASVDGRGELRVSVDGEPQPTVEVDAPGLYELASHPRHERHMLELRPSPGLSIYSIGFAAGVP
jgi:hypothetical protein